MTWPTRNDSERIIIDDFTVIGYGTEWIKVEWKLIMN